MSISSRPLFIMFQEIMLGKSKVVLTGGSDNMSMAPYAARDLRFGPKIGVDFKLEVLF